MEPMGMSWCYDPKLKYLSKLYNKKKKGFVENFNIENTHKIQLNPNYVNFLTEKRRVHIITKIYIWLYYLSFQHLPF